jgi:hypothetical protein
VSDIIAAVIARLQADEDVTGLVARTRIYRRNLAANPTIPCLVVHKISDIRDTETITSGFSKARVQCTAIASTDATADLISEALADALHRLTNTVISGIYFVEISDAGTTPDMNLKIPAFIYHRDFSISYQVH